MTISEKVDTFFLEVESTISKRLSHNLDIAPAEICIEAFEKAGIYFAGVREAQGGMKLISDGLTMDDYVKRRTVMIFYREMTEWPKYNEAKVKNKLGAGYNKKIKDVFNMSPKALFDSKNSGLYEEPLCWDKLSENVRQNLKKEEKTDMHSCNGRNFNIDAAAADLCDIYKLNYIEEGLAKELSQKYNLDIHDVIVYISNYLWRYINSDNPDDESRDEHLIKDLKSDDVIYMYFTCKLTHNEIRHILYLKAKNKLTKDIKKLTPEQLENEIIRDRFYNDAYEDEDYEPFYGSYEYYDGLADVCLDTYFNFEYDWEYGDAADCLEEYEVTQRLAAEEYQFEMMMEESKNREYWEKYYRNCRIETSMLRLLLKSGITEELRNILSNDYSDIEQVPSDIMEKLTSLEKKQLKWKDLTPVQAIMDAKIRDLLSRYGLDDKIKKIHLREGINENKNEIKVRMLFEPKNDEFGYIILRSIDELVDLSMPGLMTDGYNVEEQVALEKIGVNNPNILYVAAKRVGIDYNDAIESVKNGVIPDNICEGISNIKELYYYYPL